MPHLHSPESAVARAHARYYTPPAVDSWPAWVENAEAQVNAATLADFVAAGCTVDSDTDEAVVLILSHLGIDCDDADADVAELLITAATRRFRVVRKQLEAALDATAEAK